MEELLNKLIEKGWYPFWRKYNAVSLWDFNTISFNYYNDIDEERGVANYSIRELVSKESGLWQFCCKNRFLKWPDSTDEWQKNPIWASFDELFYADSYQFYLIESALCDEDKLEKFLLENIKI